MTLVAFVCAVQPLSVNAKSSAAKRATYRERLAAAFDRARGGSRRPSGPCYGIVYYFPKGRSTTDADNISKPLWDALRGVAYEDDAVLRFRQAGVIDTSETDMSELDLTNMPDEAAERLLELVGEGEHTLYIEIGSLRADMFVFGLASRGH
jgi:hypothetical protein